MRTRSRSVAPVVFAAVALVLTAIANGPLASSIASAASRTTLTLPSSGTASSSAPAFEAKQTGTGKAGRFEITNGNSSAFALDAVNAGQGHALFAENSGLGRAAFFFTSNSGNPNPAFEINSRSLSSAALIRQNNVNADRPATEIIASGKGVGLALNQGGTGGLARFQVDGVNRVVVDRAGRGSFEGGTRSHGRSVTEAMAFAGGGGTLHPGDVLAISTGANLEVTKAHGAYSMLVAGVVADRPGVVLADKAIGAPLDGTVAVAVAGIAKVRVSTANGTIHRGDLLVASPVGGVAMRGTDRARMLGAILGKALAGYGGSGTTQIPVLITLG